MTILILAYIDPGLGALLWQMIVAAFVGFLFYLKKTRRWIVGVIMGVFRKMFGRSQKPSDTVAKIPAEETMKAKSNVR